MNLDHSTKRCITQCKAGTGKSAVIQAMCKMLDDIEPGSPGKFYQVLAPTGAAAFNVNGKTIQSSLHIPNNSHYEPLNGENSQLFQLEFRNIKFIIIDKCPMVGLRLLRKIHLRLCEAKGSSDELFGGFFIYLFGGLRQLPPVKDTAIYMPARDDTSRQTISLVFSFQKRIILTINHRQADNQARFRQLLDNISRGSADEEDWRLLMTRQSAVSPANMRDFADSIHHLHIKSDVDKQFLDEVHIEHFSNSSVATTGIQMFDRIQDLIHQVDDLKLEQFSFCREKQQIILVFNLSSYCLGNFGTNYHVL